MQVVNPSPTAVYTGISNAMVTISRVEGVRTLWRGVSSVVVGAGPAHAVYFATYESVKNAMGGNEGEKHTHHPLAAGTKPSFPLVSTPHSSTDSISSCQRCFGHHSERCAHESL
jgi:hypothetical protein